MKGYLDTSVIAAFFVRDALSAQADALLLSNPWHLVISDFAAAEFASAVSRRVRMGDLPVDLARRRIADFDAWTSNVATKVEVLPADIAAADSHLRRLDLSLRTPDAIHVAVAHRLAATLLTLDRRMSSDAGLLGVPVAVPL